MDKQIIETASDASLIAQAANSSFYADKLADTIEAQGLMNAPANLKSSVLERSKQMDVQLIARSNQLSKKLELFSYGLKVSAAVVCCVGFILITPTSREETFFSRLPSEHTPLHVEASEKIHTWTEKIQDFSKQIWDREELSNDK